MTEFNSYWPSGPTGTNNLDDDLVMPWWIPGWTSQNGTNSQYDPSTGTEIGPNPDYVVVADKGQFVGAAFPKNLNFLRITGTFVDPNSSGIPGFITVFMSDNITVEDGGNYYRLPQRLTGTMNFPPYLAYNNWGSGMLYLGFGRLDITVFCTDQTVSGSTITTDGGQPFTYWVVEHFMGGRQYQITAPSASSPGPVDINSLIVSGSIRKYNFDPANPMGNELIPMDFC